MIHKIRGCGLAREIGVDLSSIQVKYLPGRNPESRAQTSIWQLENRGLKRA